MGILNKEQILAADKRKTVDVNVPEWGGSVRLQEMSASERDAWENASYSQAEDDDGNPKVKFNPRHVRARLVVRLLVGEDGKRLFSDDEVAAVGSLSASSIQKLFNAGSKLNAIGADDIKELEKNSDAAQSGDSSSDSASTSA